MNANLPALAAEIVSKVHNSIGDSRMNQETVVQNLIAEAMEKEASQPCVTASYAHDPNAFPKQTFVIFLRDGTKITVGRTRETTGPAWLEIKPQANIVEASQAMEKKPEPELKTFIPNPPSQEVQAIWDRFNRAIQNIVHENNLRIEQLTEAQCTQAIIQAFQCGDFKRLVRASDNAQQVIYAPWQESEMQQAKIKELKDLICHAYVHDNYRDLGISEMTTPQKKLFLAILRELGMPESAESLKHHITDGSEV